MEREIDIQYIYTCNLILNGRIESEKDLETYIESDSGPADVRSKLRRFFASFGLDMNIFKIERKYIFPGEAEDFNEPSVKEKISKMIDNKCVESELVMLLMVVNLQGKKDLDINNLLKREYSSVPYGLLVAFYKCILQMISKLPDKKGMNKIELRSAVALTTHIENMRMGEEFNYLKEQVNRVFMDNNTVERIPYWADIITKEKLLYDIFIAYDNYMELRKSSYAIGMVERKDNVAATKSADKHVELQKRMAQIYEEYLLNLQRLARMKKKLLKYSRDSGKKRFKIEKELKQIQKDFEKKVNETLDIEESRVERDDIFDFMIVRNILTEEQQNKMEMLIDSMYDYSFEENRYKDKVNDNYLEYSSENCGEIIEDMQKGENLDIKNIAETLKCDIAEARDIFELMQSRI